MIGNKVFWCGTEAKGLLWVLTGIFNGATGTETCAEIGTADDNAVTAVTDTTVLAESVGWAMYVAGYKKMKFNDLDFNE